MNKTYEIANTKEMVFNSRPMFSLSGREIVGMLATADILASKAQSHDGLTGKMIMIAASRIEDQALAELIFRT